MANMKTLLESMNNIEDESMDITDTVTERTLHADNQADELEMLKEDIMEMVGQAFDLIENSGTRERARSYWYGSIMSALGSDEYFGQSMHSMQVNPKIDGSAVYFFD